MLPKKTAEVCKSEKGLSPGNIDELGYYSRKTFNCWKDLFSIVDLEKQGNVFLKSLPPGTPAAPWLVGLVE
jgi:hypothetical protein